MAATKGASQRSPENVSPLIDGQVLVSFHENPLIGFDGSFNEQWETIGILDDGTKIDIQKTVEKSKKKGWGYGVVSTTVKPGELTAKASVIERNATVDRNAWPDREDKTTEAKEKFDGVKSAEVPFGGSAVALPYVAMVVTDQKGDLEIIASRYPAIATMQNIGYGEDPEGKEIEFDFKIGQMKDAFDRIKVGSAAKAARKVDLLRFSEKSNGEKVAAESVKNFTVKFDKAASSGSFTLTVNGKQTEAIDYNAAASKIQEEILKVTTGVTVTGSSATSGYTVKGAASVTANGAKLGDSAKVTVSEG
ncbi:hypothetical protein [Corynebacterium silvaticum]|uniref:Uncharacterized protein n=1 Tax=Corynebacterium silvaticum TaxID=2320431 RepID=A0A7Y4LH82_9CORY|nr:hypothetical protein [Corynebacterium silvaticum]ARU46727.1 hypothetical protein CBE74_10005 [Corynebacterium silvaticum]MBH5300893.1 hypothetical protein [Corynebacterium silvaticum]NOM65092.1 hypothetical protein [Corynebacterium silvaticum]NON70029.1 hypothetical protein [Corynebacterium silvaticum]TFA91652.1 hypothetical protein EU802_10130 [Corynebacterium silvaticum]